MEASAAVEKHHSKETALQRFARHTGEFSTAFSRMMMLAVILTPVLLTSFLTIDIPMRMIDGFFGESFAVRPSNWLSYGGLFMGVALLVTVLFARKYGGDEASRAVTASWGLAAVAVFAELSYLAPALEGGDMPSVRFTIVFVASAMAGQYIAANVYDIARGGGNWWRAPLYAALCGYIVHVLIYFPGIYLNAPAPWLNWMIGDFAVKVLLAFAFLPLYGMLRKPLKPQSGYGGV